MPALVRPPLAQLADVFALTVPDPYTQGRMSVMLEALRLARKAVGNEVAQVEAEMDEANAAAVFHALDLASDALIAFGKACWDAGADILHCGNSLAQCRYRD